MFDLLFLIIILLFFYMFLRLLNILVKKNILTGDDIFYITSTPLEYKKQKLKNKEGS